MPYLLPEIDNPKHLGYDFIAEAVARFAKPKYEETKAVFVQAMAAISRTASTVTMGEDYKQYMNVCFHAILEPIIWALTTI